MTNLASDYLVFLFFVIFALVSVKISIYFSIRTYFILFYIYLLFKTLNINLSILHFISLKYYFLSWGYLFKATATMAWPWLLTHGSCHGLGSMHAGMPWPWQPKPRQPPWACYQRHSMTGNFLLLSQIISLSSSFMVKPKQVQRIIKIFICKAIVIM